MEKSSVSFFLDWGFVCLAQQEKEDIKPSSTINVIGGYTNNNDEKLDHNSVFEHISMEHWTVIYELF
jgi:hypothetical protein